MNQPYGTIETFCTQRSEIAAYLDGELAPREELELEKHFAGCASCAAELNEQKRLLLVLDFAAKTETEIELPKNFTKIVVANAESRVSGLRQPQERRRALFACAGLFLLTLAFFGAETDVLLNTFWKSTDQFLAVGGFVWKLFYDLSTAAAVIVRSVGNHLVYNSATTTAVLGALFFAALLVLSRLVHGFHRS